MADETLAIGQGFIAKDGANIIVQAIGKANLAVEGDCDRVELQPSELSQKVELTTHGAHMRPIEY